MHVSEFRVCCKFSCSIWRFSVSAVVMAAAAGGGGWGGQGCRAGKQAFHQRGAGADLMFPAWVEITAGLGRKSEWEQRPTRPGSDNDTQTKFGERRRRWSRLLFVVNAWRAEVQGCSPIQLGIHGELGLEELLQFLFLGEEIFVMLMWRQIN